MNSVTVLHFIFAVVATVFFIWQFISTKKLYQLVLVFWIPSTLLKYISSNPSYLIKIGILEIVFLLLFIIGLIIDKIKTVKQAEKDVKISDSQNGFDELK